MIKNILSIAGSDPSGGAGIQADLKTFAALGAYGMATITALTVQNTRGVSAMHHVPHSFVADQIRSIFDDIRVDAVKIGMAGGADTIRVIADILNEHKPAHIVLDPVMVATSGDALSDDKSVQAMRDHLLPVCTLLTPNIPEAEVLLGQDFQGDLEAFARGILSLGVPAVYLKGGHLDGDQAVDIYMDQNCIFALSTPMIETKNTHGTGCTLSSALAVFLGQGHDTQKAARHAKDYITGAIKGADNLKVGDGHGPVHHGFL